MATKKQSAASYRDMQHQLDELLDRMQDPACDVDAAVKYYEQALALIAAMDTHLQQAENRITKIRADFDAAFGNTER